MQLDRPVEARNRSRIGPAVSEQSKASKQASKFSRLSVSDQVGLFPEFPLGLLSLNS